MVVAPQVAVVVPDDAVAARAVIVAVERGLSGRREDTALRVGQLPLPSRGLTDWGPYGVGQRASVGGCVRSGMPGGGGGVTGREAKWAGVGSVGGRP